MSARTVFIVVSGLAFSGCASTPVDLDTMREGSIIVVPAIGSTMQVTYIGDSVFDPSDREILIPEAGIDRLVAESISKNLDASTVFTEIYVASREESQSFLEFSPYLSTSFFDMSKHKALTKEIAESYNADYVLVVAESMGGTGIYGDFVRGYGIDISSPKLGLGERGTSVYLSMAMMLYRGETGKEIAAHSEVVLLPKDTETWIEKEEGKNSEKIQQVLRIIRGEYLKLAAATLSEIGLLNSQVPELDSNQADR